MAKDKGKKGKPAKKAAPKEKEQPKAAATEAAEERESTAKEQIYQEINDFVKAKTGKKIGRTGGRQVCDLVVELIFATAVKEGTFRFNAGFGSLQLRDYSAGSRRLPSGQQVEFGERKKLRYEEGVVVKSLVSNGGDIEDARRARSPYEQAGLTKGQVDSDEEENGEDETTPAPAPAKKAAAKKAAPEPVEEDDEDIDLDEDLDDDLDLD